MLDLKRNIEDICRWKGIDLSSIANRMGVSYTILVNSIESNPTIRVLQRIAECLDVPLSEIISEVNKPPSLGFAIINGESYHLSKPMTSILRIPSFARYDDLRESTIQLFEEGKSKDEMSSIIGIFDLRFLFSLLYDPSLNTFYLSTCNSCDGHKVLCFDCYEHASWGDAATETNPVWDFDSLSKDIIDGITRISGTL